jgi:hypothetical protein
VVVKLQNKEGIEKLNCFAYKSYYNPPDYLYKFGVTPQVSRILSSMQESGFFTTFEIKPSPCEYVVGKNFLVEEYVPGPNLRKINEKMQKTTNKTVYGRRKEFWAKWFSSFKEEQISLEELFFLVGTERGEPFTQTDFNFPDWILRGYNSSSGRVQLSLIDQTPAGVAYDISMYPIIEQEKEEKKETLRQKWNKRPELEHLMHYSL